MILGDVFGGASMAYSGSIGTNSDTKSELYIGDDSQTGNNVGVTILGDVYGANNLKGSPLGTIEVHVYSIVCIIMSVAPAAV